MKTLAYSFAGLVLAATAAHAQPAADPATEAEGPDAAATSAADATTPADAAEPVADAAPAPADDAVAASAEVSDADIDSFAKATVKLQAIQADTAIAADQKQTAMAAAVAEVGLDPAKYTAIGKAAQSDAALRAKVQTAMSKYAPPAPAEG